MELKSFWALGEEWIPTDNEIVEVLRKTYIYASDTISFREAFLAAVKCGRIIPAVKNVRR